MNQADQEWIASTVFTPSGTLASPVKLWYYPPATQTTSSPSSKPNPQNYFRRRLCLWIPRRAYKFDFHCPHCNKSLRPKGLYKRLRVVLDIKDWYYLATEYMYCGCGITINAWDTRILEQLPIGIRVKFPALLTLKYACDTSLISFLKSRTLGNSPTAFLNSLKEIHGETWVKKNIQYMYDCLNHKKSIFLQGAEMTYGS